MLGTLNCAPISNLGDELIHCSCIWSGLSQDKFSEGQMLQTFFSSSELERFLSNFESPRWKTVGLGHTVDVVAYCQPTSAKHCFFLYLFVYLSSLHPDHSPLSPPSPTLTNPSTIIRPSPREGEGPLGTTPPWD